MEWIKEIIDKLGEAFKWYIIIMPWEQGLSIWLGRKYKILKPGLHIRIPYLHSIYVQSVRLSFINICPQTITTKSGETLTISLVIGYSITDVFKLYNSVSEVQGAITGVVVGLVSEHVVSNDLENCGQENIILSVKKELKKKDWGISISEINIYSFAIVKTFRLIQDGHWLESNHSLDDKR